MKDFFYAKNAQHRYQYKGIKKSGEVGWVDQYSKTVLYNGKPADMICMIEITDRKQAEEKLRESEKRFRELAEMLPECVFETDLQMNLTFANQKAFSLFGFSPEDFDQEMNGLNMVIPEDRKRAQDNIKRRLKGENLGLVEYTGLRKDGTTFPVLMHMDRINHKGAITGFRGVIVDISERKQTEEKLSASNEPNSDEPLLQRRPCDAGKRRGIKGWPDRRIYRIG